MKKLFILLAVIFVTCISCEQSNVRKGRNAYKEYFRENLKDPSSLVIHSERIVSNKNSKVVFVVDVGAKNSFGGYVRNTYRIKTKYGIITSVSNDYGEDREDKEEPIMKYRERTIPEGSPFDVYQKKLVKTSLDIRTLNQAIADTYKNKPVTVKENILSSKRCFDLKSAINTYKEEEFHMFNIKIDLGVCKIIPKDSIINIRRVIMYDNNPYIEIGYQGEILNIEPSAIY